MAELPPVLILAFDRPDLTRQVLDRVWQSGVKTVFLAVDGPRADRAQDLERVRAVRDLALGLERYCEVKTLFRSRNLGCKVAVSEAISWFFDQVEEGIILEDDCLAEPTFFSFAAELLDLYRNDQRIFMISGDNFQFGRRRTDYSYYFSRYTHTWGWATWRRAWRLYDHDMKLWPELKAGDWLQDLLQNPAACRYWTRIFDETHAEHNAAWDYRWTFAAWVNAGLSILPNINLVSNIGFGPTGTHTWWRWSRVANMRTKPMHTPLRHPPFRIRDARADEYTQRTMFRFRWWRRAARKAYTWWRRGAAPA
jgi:hypothetical protein